MATHIADDVWGEGSKREQSACSALCQLSVTSPITHNKIGPFWCWFPGGCACLCSRPLCVSSTNSPVRLGVSPSASTPTGVFNQKFEALFPCVGAPHCAVCPIPQLFLPVYLHTNMGQPGSSHRLATPQLPIPTPPTGLGECFFFNSLVVGLSSVLVVFCFKICCCPSFGCARRNSVSTYISILARSLRYTGLF